MNNILNFIINLRKNEYMGKFVQVFLQLLYKIDLPKSVKIGENIQFVHNSPGLVIHPNTIIGNNVKLYQGVTLGRADIYNDIEHSLFKSINIEDDVIICAGAKVLCKEGNLIVKKGTVVGANSVLVCSTGENEIWAGIPAKKIGYRKL